MRAGLVLALGLIAAPVALQADEGGFVLANRTEAAVSSLLLAPAGTGAWSGERLSGVLPAGGQAAIGVDQAGLYDVYLRIGAAGCVLANVELNPADDVWDLTQDALGECAPV